MTETKNSTIQLPTTISCFNEKTGTTRTVKRTEECLGKGGFAEVFYATDLEDSSLEFAIKVINLNKLNEPNLEKAISKVEKEKKMNLQ